MKTGNVGDSSSSSSASGDEKEEFTGHVRDRSTGGSNSSRKKKIVGYVKRSRSGFRLFYFQMLFSCMLLIFSITQLIRVHKCEDQRIYTSIITSLFTYWLPSPKMKEDLKSKLGTDA